MALEPWKQTDNRVVFEHRWWRARQVGFTMPSGRTGEYFFVDQADGVMVIAVNDQGKIATVQQYRLPINSLSLEFPAGGTQADKTFSDTALKELAEEIGYSAKDLAFVGSFYSSVGLTNQRCHTFVAWNLFPSAAEGDETEDIEVKWYSFEELEKLMADGSFKDAWSLLSWALSKDKIKKICQEYA